MAIRRAVRAMAVVLGAALWACGGGGTGGTDLVFGDPGGADARDVAGPDEAAGDTGRELPADEGTTDLPGADVTGMDGTAQEVPYADVPVVDLPHADLPIADVPVPELPVADVPVGDVPVQDPGRPDVPAADPGADAGPEVTGPEPWVQCTTDEPCKALFGEHATCNHDFPGGQCMGCDPEAPGVHVKCTQLSHQVDITLSCRMANGGVCLYDCPCPSWLRCLENEGLCVLKTCTEDAQCGPFQCLEIGNPGSNRYCLPPR